jgi:pilus assembly protein Flp/PilA
MNTLMKASAWLKQAQQGASAVEYAILIGLIAIAVIAGAILLGPAITGLFTNVSGQLPQ